MVNCVVNIWEWSDKYCVKWQKLLRDNIYKRKSVITVNINIAHKRIRVVSQITEKYRHIIHEAAPFLELLITLLLLLLRIVFKYFSYLYCLIKVNGQLIMESNALKIIFIIVKTDIYWVAIGNPSLIFRHASPVYNWDLIQFLILYDLWNVSNFIFFW